MRPACAAAAQARDLDGAMRTLILSDLHLGSSSRADLLRRGEVREKLLRAVAEVDRVVLLGDVLELRHGPPHAALGVARPFFEELGRALAGSELVLVAGNHDHALIEPWLALRAELPDSAPLALEQIIAPGDASPTVKRLAEWAGPARTSFAYPGLWLRPDVYATHGHYLDCHLTVPTIERLSVGVMSRLLRRPAELVRQRRRLRGGHGADVRLAARRRARHGARRRAERDRDAARLARAARRQRPRRERRRRAHAHRDAQGAAARRRDRSRLPDRRRGAEPRRHRPAERGGLAAGAAPSPA